MRDVKAILICPLYRRCRPLAGVAGGYPLRMTWCYLLSYIIYGNWSSIIGEADIQLLTITLRTLALSCTTFIYQKNTIRCIYHSGAAEDVREGTKKIDMQAEIYREE